MDNKFVWQESFNIGVATIDAEHEKLFKIINKLFRFKEKKMATKWAYQEGIKFFKKHTLEHFLDEEGYMASINYEWREQHKLLHKGFREITLPALERELEQSGYSDDAVEHFFGVCAGWLIGHTMTEDLAIAGKCSKKQPKFLQGEDVEDTKKVVIQTIFDMFQLESHLISDAYNGEKFGDGIYYRLVYKTPKSDKKQEIMLVFEEKLLINTVGKIMGIKTNKLDNMLIHATRYTARQFVNRVLEQFAEKDYELQSESLLSYEQFQKIFENNLPHIKLLLDTGAGYFSYCVIAPHIIKGDVEISIEHKNAINKVNEYLKKRENLGTNKKILVVDDSMVVLQYMEELLSGDYDITTADSGIAAIRSIILNKPDLVLLDYEMPVCDGKQLLEMIRFDPKTENVPVIFLTGRNDYESVKKVKDLKPDGYLLKQLKPEDIKKSIDLFFDGKKIN